MQQLTGLCSSDCLQWAIPRRQRNPVAQENGQEMLARTRGHLPTPQRKSPESLEILGACLPGGFLNPVFSPLRPATPSNTGLAVMWCPHCAALPCSNFDSFSTPQGKLSIFSCTASG